MYRKHFALTRHPFDKELAADELFESGALAELGARLRHLVDMRGIGLVTGDSLAPRAALPRRPACRSCAPHPGVRAPSQGPTLRPG